MEQILRLDMGTLTHRFEPLPEAYALLGGRALTSRILCDELDPTVDALGPNNKLVLAPGLLSGSIVSSSSRISAGAKSPLTGGIKESNSGGNTGWRLAQHGLRAVIIDGAAPVGQWFIAVISRGECRLEAAGDLVGLGTYDTATRLFERFGAKSALAVIGPAGEQRMNVAGICNTDPEGRPSRICARGGMGAVMGSKGLKAIVVRDPGANIMPDTIDLPMWRENAKVYAKELATSPAIARYRNFGTASTLELVNKLGGLPIRNFSRGQDAQAEAITGLQMAETIKARGGQTSHSCMTGCAIQCSNVWVDPQGKEVASSMEFETNTLLGANLEIFDFDAIARFTKECNDLGIDTIETGGAMGVAMAAGALPYGDVAAVIDAFGQIRTGTVLGKLLGAGAATVGRVLGVREVASVKGQVMAAYDPRVIKGNGVTYATSPMGADHTAGNTIGAKVDHLDPQGKVALSRELQIVSTVLDMLGFCVFARAVYATTAEQFRGLFAARFGRSITDDEIRAIATETIRREIAFNRAAGLGPATDRIPEWMRTTPLRPHEAVFDVPDEELDRIWATD
ncbi:MAG TPA: aldehyde ferredoxin oxidoreductase C-terminal domain-containing protein [Symbiobacteriaceae bacterium]|nr:aldehyde ferredoxin oxidoreductase C-terminal domain-containing protein [Symbiobacteriaceae bacterium]